MSLVNETVASSYYSLTDLLTGGNGLNSAAGALCFVACMFMTVFIMMVAIQFNPITAIERLVNRLKQTRKEAPIKYPDALGIKKGKKGHYILHGRKRTYLTEKELCKMYNHYISSLKYENKSYPTRVITL